MATTPKPLLAGVAYAGLMAAAGCLDPFASVMLSQRGLSSTQIGAVLSAKLIFGLVSAPLWAAVADKGGRHRLVAAVCTVASAAFSLLFAAFCSAGVASAVALAVPVCALHFTRAPLGPLLDEAALRVLGPSGRARYGKLRMWGGVSFGIVGTLVGVVALPVFGTLFSPTAFAFFILLALPALLALLSSAQATATTAPSSPPPPVKHSFGSALKQLAVTPGVATFAFSLLTQGFAGNVISNFYPLIVAADTAASKTILGYSVGVSVLAELPVFWFSEQLLNRFGPRKLIAIAQAATIARLLGYTVLQGNLRILPQLLHGLTFAAMWMSTVVYAGQIAPPQVAATAQSLVSAIYASLSGILCNIISGWIFDTFGAVAILRAAATFCAASFVIFWTSTPRSPRSTKGKSN